MITQIVEVVETTADTMTVKPQQQGCQSCSTGSCGVSNIARLFGNRQHQLRVINTSNFKAGELAELCLDESIFMRSVVLQYLLPLVSMILSVMLVSFVTSSLVIQLIVAIFGMAIGVYLARYLIKQNEHRLEGRHLQVRRIS